MQDQCRSAIEHLSAHLEGRASQPADVEAAIAHIRSCQDCLRNVEYLMRASSIAEEDILSCGPCQDLLPDYHHAVLDGHTDQARWRPVALHLQLCPHCEAAYAEIADMFAIGDGERGEEPPIYPTPQLPFLRPKPAAAQQTQQPWWHWNQFGRLVIAFSEELLRSLPPPPQLAYATAQHRANALMAPLWLLTLDEELDSMAVRITAAQMQNDLERCTLLIDVNIPGRGWPDLAGARVILKRGDEHLATQETDAYGKAAFEAVAIAELPVLVIEIERPETGAEQ
jgi:hypothetical protein